MEYQLLNSILHGHALNEPRTWFFIAATIAVCVAGWHCGDILFAYTEKAKGEE